MPLYIDHMKPSITIVITEPMINAAIRRLRLNIRCSDEYTNWYIRKNMMKVETAIMAENRPHPMLSIFFPCYTPLPSLSFGTVRKDVVAGKDLSVSLDLGGRR